MTGTELARAAWSEESGVAGVILRAGLLPASALFRVVSRAHHGLYDAGLRRAARAGIPVISVGNLRVGGAGKTPLTGWVVDRLIEMGRRPAVLHGGYGSDEPDLHRRWHPNVPVLVGRDRAAGARVAMDAGRDVAVLDDGFQHRRLARDLDIVLLAAEQGADPIRLLPRGPWREPLTALRRAGAIVVTRKTATPDEADALSALIRARVERRAVHAWIRPDGWSDLAGNQVATPTRQAIAVAAIAEPESFFATISSLGVPLADRIAFPDHHTYTNGDIERIVRAAAGRPVLTTAKDGVKLGALGDEAEVCVLEQRVTIEDGEAELVERIGSALG